MSELPQVTLSASEQDLQCTLQVAQALSDPIRLRILTLLVEGRQCCGLPEAGPGGGGTEGVCVCELVEQLALIQSKVSYHLAKLKEARLVKEERRGKWNYYSVDREGARVFLQSCARTMGTVAGYSCSSGET